MFEAMDHILLDREFHLEVQVGDQWKGVHVHNQSTYDHAAMIRHSGNGNIFKIVKRADGTYNLLVQVDFDYTEWKGIHVTSQHTEDTTPLIRDRGEGNAFRLEKVSSSTRFSGSSWTSPPAACA